MSGIITPRDAAKQLLQRRAARNSIEEYISYMDFGFVPMKHHRLMISKFEAVARGEIPLLGLALPPGSAKSTYGSMIFPAWYLGNNPTLSVLACSHTQTLADRFGRKVRNIFSRQDHARLFGVGISRDSQAAGAWSTERDGEYFAAGVGVAIAGRRADIGIIDDPVPNRAAADSLTFQENCWDWYINDFLPRLKPNAAQIIISTRWNEGDLLGRILERERNKWDLVELPMEARENDPLGRAPGERLWPEWFTDEQIAVAKQDTRSWSALYQQTPVVDEGDYFKAAWLKTEYEHIPDNAHYYGASDYAVTEGHGDFTEHGIFALDMFGNIYIVDWWRGQTTADVWIERQIDLINSYEPLTWFGEAGPIRRAIEPQLALRMTERNAYTRLEWLPSIGDKATRLRAFQARASAGKVFLPKVAAWKAELVQQLTRFPAARHDDGVDVCSLIGRGLDLIRTPRKSSWSKASAGAFDLGSGSQSWMSY